MPTLTMHSKNKNYYSHCPLKKRPVFMVKEGKVDLFREIFFDELENMCVELK
jgi:hypothetical protein